MLEELLINITLLLILPAGISSYSCQENRKHSQGNKIKWNKWQRAKEWELPAPISCRLLNNQEYEISEKDIVELNLGQLAIVEGLKSIVGIEYPTKRILKTWVKSLPGGNSFINNLTRWHGLLNKSIIEDCGKSQLLPNAISIFSPDEFPKEKVTSSRLSKEAKVPSEYKIVLDPEKGEFILRKEPDDVKVNYHYGLSGPIGAGDL